MLLQSRRASSRIARVLSRPGHPAPPRANVPPRRNVPRRSFPRPRSFPRKNRALIQYRWERYQSNFRPTAIRPRQERHFPLSAHHLPACLPPRVVHANFRALLLPPPIASRSCKFRCGFSESRHAVRERTGRRSPSARFSRPPRDDTRATRRVNFRTNEQTAGRTWTFSISVRSTFILPPLSRATPAVKF